jgi:hypothetical protein
LQTAHVVSFAIIMRLELIERHTVFRYKSATN